MLKVELNSSTREDIMKKLMIIALLLGSLHTARAAVESVFVHNESGVGITVHVVFEDKTFQTKSLSPNERAPFYVEDTCLRQISVYSGRWNNVSDIEPDEKFVVPENWNRCQTWIFTIKKRMDDTVHIASKKNSLEKAPSLK